MLPLKRLHWIAALAMIGTPLVGCVHKTAPVAATAPAEVEKANDAGISRLRLTPKAVERLGIRTAPVHEIAVAGSAHGGMRKVIPYSSVLYDSHGDTWTYTSPEPQVYVRERIVVDFIDQDMAILSESPPNGTQVVNVGAAELFGTEFKVGH